MQKIPMTNHGAQLLTKELENLEKVQRPQVVQAIAEARAHGDLKENAEYHAAKDQQGLIEGRIRHIQSRLSNAQIIDVTKIKNDGTVVFGSTVHIVNLDTDQEQTYQIVGEEEADIKLSKISIGSPIARALIGKKVGAEVEVKTPGGSSFYEILKVEYV
ncbi:MAG: transcription elongation factor GreA [Gammaproteobacteria bacterium]